MCYAALPPRFPRDQGPRYVHLTQRGDACRVVQAVLALDYIRCKFVEPQQIQSGIAYNEPDDKPLEVVLVPAMLILLQHLPGLLVSAIAGLLSADGRGHACRL